MIFKKETCAKCRVERSVRICARLSNKQIGWKCCNALRIDLRCPQECPYAPKYESGVGSPFPTFRSDSNTEFVQVVKRYIDQWCYLPISELDGAESIRICQRSLR